MCGLIQAEAMTPPACEPFLVSLLEGTLSINKADFEPLQRESNFERQITEKSPEVPGRARRQLRAAHGPEALRCVQGIRPALHSSPWKPGESLKKWLHLWTSTLKDTKLPQRGSGETCYIVKMSYSRWFLKG